MQTPSYESLVFRRQYLISKNPVKCPFIHEKSTLREGFVLYRHPDLVYAEHEGEQSRIILLGDILNWENPDWSNADILRQLGKMDLQGILENIPHYGGRYALLIIDRKGIHILNDATTCRKVYYHEGENGISLASNPNLLAEAVGAKLTTEQSMVDYQKSKKFLMAECTFVLDVTAYEGVRHLIPNHVISLEPFRIRRFWPSYAMEPKSEKEIVAESAAIMKGFMEAAHNRYPLMIPITAGYDSRVLLAVSREWSKDIYYFINYYDHLESTADGYIPEKVMKDVGLEFHLNLTPECKDQDFLKAYSRNHFQHNPQHIDAIYSFYRHFPERLSLPGNGITLIKSKFRTTRKNPDGRDLAGIFGFENYDFAVKAYEKWLADLGSLAVDTNTYLNDLIAWEDMIANWHSQLQQCKDIAQEDMVIFNSAYLMSRAMTYNSDRRTKPLFHFHRDLIKLLWPELMKYPFNPSFRNRTGEILGWLGLYKPAARIKGLIKRLS